MSESTPPEINLIPPMVKAMEAVEVFCNNLTHIAMHRPVYLNDLEVLWFSQGPNGWNAMVVSKFLQDQFFEVLHNGVDNTTTVNFYQKLDGVTMPVMGLGC